MNIHELIAIVEQTLSDHQDKVDAIKEGNTNLRGWFVGQVMKATNGKADPATVFDLVEQRT